MHSAWRGKAYRNNQNIIGHVELAPCNVGLALEGLVVLAGDGFADRVYINALCLQVVTLQAGSHSPLQLKSEGCSLMKLSLLIPTLQSPGRLMTFESVETCQQHKEADDSQGITITDFQQSSHLMDAVRHEV